MLVFVCLDDCVCLFICLRVESTIQYMTFEKYERCPRATNRYQMQNTISIQQVYGAMWHTSTLHDSPSCTGWLRLEVCVDLWGHGISIFWPRCSLYLIFTLSLHLFFGLLPGDLHSHRSSYDAILSPPLHMDELLNKFLLNLLSISSRSHLVSTSSLGPPSWHLTPAMYLNILLSFVPIISCNLTVKGHVSEPYNRTGLMHASYTLARCLKGTQRLTKRLDISSHFSQDAKILPLTHGWAILRFLCVPVSL